MIKDKYLSSAEAARLLGFTPDHVRRLIIQGKIKAEKVGHNWLVKPKDILHVRRIRHKKEM